MKEIKRLTNAEMENVVGGFNKRKVGTGLMIAGNFPVMVGAAASTALHIGGVVCSAKAKKALANGDVEGARKLVSTSEALNIGALSAGAAGTVVTAGLEISGKLMGGTNTLFNTLWDKVEIDG